MLINANLDSRAIVHVAQEPWIASPMQGVDRRMLDRIGDEVARATSIVRYAPGSSFSSHTHTGGEEYFVLDGVFQDEHGDFPAGTYVRNPPTSSHSPRSDNGATIWVKLWQFDLADRHQMSVDSTTQTPVCIARGVSEIKLYEDNRENVRIEIWNPQTPIKNDDHLGLELLVLEGSFTFDGEAFEKHSWLRLPPGDNFAAKSGPDGARLLIKSDHLAGPQLASKDRS
ncbi:cupin domain-containing protein [Hyphobacterium sp.]|uniref:cupin domain-containing protein n=1 Tax=Hyphobacterium sp. TaxID=2004662 RepID=UPI003BA87513